MSVGSQIRIVQQFWDEIGLMLYQKFTMLSSSSVDVKSSLDFWSSLVGVLPDFTTLASLVTLQKAKTSLPVGWFANITKVSIIFSPFETGYHTNIFHCSNFEKTKQKKKQKKKKKQKQKTKKNYKHTKHRFILVGVAPVQTHIAKCNCFKHNFSVVSTLKSFMSVLY